MLLAQLLQLPQQIMVKVLDDVDVRLQVVRVMMRKRPSQPMPLLISQEE